MGATHAVGRHRGRVERRRPSALAVAFGLDALSLVLFACAIPLARSHGPAETFFSDPAPAVLLLTAATTAIGAGAVAVVSLARARLASRAGRWATRLGLTNALLIPVLGGSVAAGARLLDYHLPAGWGQPIMPLWLATGLAAAILGTVAKEPGRRGLLVVPLMIGAFVLTFWLGEILAPH